MPENNDYVYQKPGATKKYDPGYEDSLYDFEGYLKKQGSPESTIDQKKAAKDKADAGGSTDYTALGTNIVGGLSAGLNQGSKKTGSGNPYDIDEQYKPDGLMATSLSSQLSYEGLKSNKKSESNFLVADWHQGVFGGGTEGFASGGWVGMFVGGVTGGITSMVEGQNERIKYKNELRDLERDSKANWIEQENMLASEGAQAGAYNSDYKPISQIAIDEEKKKMDDYFIKKRKEAGMKDYKGNYYTS